MIEPSKLDALESYSEFRKRILGWAASRLEADEPLFVSKLRELISCTGDFGTAVYGALPNLQHRALDVRELLRAIQDFELTADKLRRAQALLRTPVPKALSDEWSEAAWALYHLDHWVFMLDAWLERLDKLVARVFRTVVKARSQSWKEQEAIVRGEIQRLKENVKGQRDALAHGGGAGVSGPAEQGLLEPTVVLGLWPDIANAVYQDSAGIAQWGSLVSHVTVMALSSAESLFAQVTKAAFSEAAT